MVIRAQTTRFALFLYGLLLVLPTIGLGYLYWVQLERDYDAQLDAVPGDAQDGARRVAASMQERLAQLLASERQRPFYEYDKIFSPADMIGDELALQQSPLVKDPRPRGVLGWFSWDRFAEGDADIGLYLGDQTDTPEGAKLRASLMPALRRFHERKAKDGMFERSKELNDLQREFLPTAVIAVLYNSADDYAGLRQCYDSLRGWTLPIEISDFRLEFYMDEDDTPRAFATRNVLYLPGSNDLPADVGCLQPLAGGFALRQGLVLDVDWLIDRLPRGIAQQVLSEGQRLLERSRDLPLSNVGTVFAEIRPVEVLQFDTDLPEDAHYGTLDVEIDTARLQERLSRHMRRFLGVALMLVVTLLTGMTLLYRNVRRELEQAHRMQNFVAAVTHELRTPLSAIRLHGEMLLDGWASDPGKQRDYYRRIVRETDRLSTLVERVLEKSRLKQDRVVPRAGDLNAMLESLVPSVEAPDGGTEDLALDLEPELPEAMLTNEAVAGILSNLVENARKYAPVERGGEPISISTRREDGRVVLEVADRGPGVPSQEKERVFEAFYRSGNESTRRTQGTGLGLHLVRLHAQSVGARASVHDRPGGGSVFRIAFRIAS